MRFLWLATSIPWLVIGCSLFRADGGPDKLSPDQIRAVPESVTIDGRQLVLRTYMWRDFMPISPPDGKPLIAVFSIFSVDSTALPTDFTADAAWILNGDSVWGTFLEEENRGPKASFMFERVARNGPKWGPGIEVDAVVRLRTKDGTTHLLRAANQTIERTD